MNRYHFDCTDGTFYETVAPTEEVATARFAAVCRRDNVKGRLTTTEPAPDPQAWHCLLCLDGQVEDLGAIGNCQYGRCGDCGSPHSRRADALQDLLEERHDLYANDLKG